SRRRDHALRPLAPQDEPRRAASAVERPARADVHGRPAPLHPLRDGELRAAPFRALPRAGGDNGSLAGDGAGALDRRRGLGHGCGVRAELVFASRPVASAQDAASGAERRAGNGLMASFNGDCSRNGVARKQHPLRIAVVGLGYWGPNLVRVLHEIDEAEVAVLCDLDRSALERAGRLYPALAVTELYERVLADHHVDAVAIATPVSTHYALAAKALDAGKHVFVEKPLAGSEEQAEDLVARADRRGLTLMPGHT